MLLNSTKSEAIVIGTRKQLNSLNRTKAVVAGSEIDCSSKLKCLGFMFDPLLSCDSQVDSVVSACNYHLKAFRHIRPALSEDLAATVGRAIVMSRLDYCNSLYAGLSQSNLDRL